MRPQSLLTYPRHLHPGAWWLWAIGLAAAASRTTNPLLLVLILAVAGFVVSARRRELRGRPSYGAFLLLGLVVIVSASSSRRARRRRAGPDGAVHAAGGAAARLVSGLKLGGPVTLEAVLRAFYEGPQLAAILCCVGAANALASATPAAAIRAGRPLRGRHGLRVALTFAPQLVTDARRVRAAHRLRGGTRGAAASSGSRCRCSRVPSSGRWSWRRRWTPAGTAAPRATTAGVAPAHRVPDARRAARASARPLRPARRHARPGSGCPLLVAGVVAGRGGPAVGGRRDRRSRYRPDPWALPEWLVPAAASPRRGDVRQRRAPRPRSSTSRTGRWCPGASCWPAPACWWPCCPRSWPRR